MPTQTANRPRTKIDYQDTVFVSPSTARVASQSRLFAYISDLMDVLLTQTMVDPTDAWELWDEVEEAPALCSSVQHPDISEVVAMHTSRFSGLHQKCTDCGLDDMEIETNK